MPVAWPCSVLSGFSPQEAAIIPAGLLTVSLAAIETSLGDRCAPGGQLRLAPLSNHPGISYRTEREGHRAGASADAARRKRIGVGLSAGIGPAVLRHAGLMKSPHPF